MAVIAVISFQFPIRDFFMFYNIQTLCDTACIFSLYLINFKGVIGVPVAMAPMFFLSWNVVSQEFLGNKLFTLSLRHSQLQVHIYILFKVVIGNLSY